MGAWLAAAENLFRRGTNQPPTPFAVQCVCGRQITGLRTDAPQSPVCPDCQTRLFVLPACVYPLPRVPKRKPLAPPKPQSEFVTREADHGAAKRFPSRNASRVAAEEPANASPPRERQAPLPVAHRSLRAVINEAARAVDLKRLSRKIFTPVRLVVAGILLVVVAMAWWLLHLRALDEAQKIVVSAARRGEQALADNDLSEAARQFQYVKGALDLLGRNDLHARVLRQTAAETRAGAGLASVSLFELLHEAAAPAASSSSSPSAVFQSHYRDQWVVLDVPVALSADSAARRHYDIDFPLSDGENQAVVIADLDVFEKAFAADSQPRRLIFAAQLDDFRQDRQLDHTWQIILRPASGFLWSNTGRLEQLGVAVDDTTRQILADQTNQMGIAE